MKDIPLLEMTTEIYGWKPHKNKITCRVMLSEILYNHHLVQHVSALITAIVSYLGTRSGHL
jgi:hypothetical protein